MRDVFLFLLAALSPVDGAPAAEAPFQPHYVSQRVGQASSARRARAIGYKILWVYRHKGYPFQEIARFDVWRRVTAADGTVGWMNGQLCCPTQRTVLVTGKGRARNPQERSGGFQAGRAGRAGRGAGAEKLRSRILPRPRRSCRWLDRQVPHLGRRSGRNLQIGARLARLRGLGAGAHVFEAVRSS